MPPISETMWNCVFISTKCNTVQSTNTLLYRPILFCHTLTRVHNRHPSPCFSPSVVASLIMSSRPTSRTRAKNGQFSSRTGNVEKFCSRCGGNETSQWRTGNDGCLLCNACGIKLWRKNRNAKANRADRNTAPFGSSANLTLSGAGSSASRRDPASGTQSMRDLRLHPRQHQQHHHHHQQTLPPSPSQPLPPISSLFKTAETARRPREKFSLRRLLNPEWLFVAWSTLLVSVHS